MNRRKFLITSALAPVVLLPNSSDAFLGLLLRFILRGVLGRGVARAGAIARAGARTAIRAGGRFATNAVTAQSLQSLSPLLQTGAITMVFSEIAELVKQFDAKAIFVKDAENVVTVAGNQNLNFNVDYIVEDVQKGIESVKGGFYAVSTGDFKFDFKIKDLPFTGVGRLHGSVSNLNTGVFTSPNFVIADAEQVSYD